MDYNTFANNLKIKYPEYKDMDNLELSKKIIEKYPVYKQQVQLPAEDGYLSRVGKQYQQGGKDVVGAVTKGAELISEGQRQGGLKGIGKQALGMVKSGLGTVGAIARTAFAPITEAPVVKQGIEAVGETIAPTIQSGLETDTGQKLLEFSKQYPEAFKSLQDVIDVSTLGIGKVVEKPLQTGVESALGKGISAVKNAPEAIQAIKATPNALLDRIATENPVKLNKIKAGVAKNLNEYADEFSRSRNAISGATNKIEGFDYGKYIAEKNLLPDVTDSGRFDGRNIIKGLQEENTQLKNIVSNKLDNSVRSTPVESFKQSLLEDITSKGNIADAESMRNYVDRYINEVRNRYGDNLTDRQLYDIKVDADAGYNYLSPNADINASKLIADRARNFIRSKDEEIAKALDAQTKNYEAIRITQSLEPYKVKAGNLTTRLAQLGGSLLGANAVEGGIVQKTLAATIGGLAGQKLVKTLQQAAFISPVARKAIEKELIKTVESGSAKSILKKLDNGINLNSVESKVLERAGNQLKKSSIMINDKTTAINTPIKESIPLNKKSSQAGFISTGGKDLQPLYKEAQKYKSAEEFVKAHSVQRIEDVGVSTSFKKPQGLYTTPANVESPHSDFLKGKKTIYGIDPSSKSVTVDTSGFSKTPNERGVDQMATNLVWLRQELPDVADSIRGKSIKELKETFSKEYPKTDWNLYNEKQDMIEGYAGLKAREKGYDVLRGVDKDDPRFSEVVILNENVIKTKSQLEQIWKEANSKTSTKQGMTAVNPLTVGAGVSAVGAGAMSIKNKKKK